MYGEINRIASAPEDREALQALLLAGSDALPGCIAYIVAADLADDGALWVSEVWESEASHAASLSLPAVRAAIEKARPMITGFEKVATTRPAGGTGLSGG